MSFKYKRPFLFLFVVAINLVSCRDRGKIVPEVISKERKYEIEFEKQLINSGIDKDGIVNDVLTIPFPDSIKSLHLIQILDFSQLNIFKNLEFLSIGANFPANRKFESLDLNQHKNLEVLEFSSAGSIAENCSINIENCLKLKSISIHLNGNLNEINFNKFLDLGSLEIQRVKNMEVLNLEKLVKMSSLSIINCPLNKLILHPQHQIGYLSLRASKLNEIDLALDKNLYYIQLDSLPNIKFLDISSSKNIRTMGSYLSPNLKTICVNKEQKIDSIPSPPGQPIKTIWFKDPQTSWVVCKTQ